MKFTSITAALLATIGVALPAHALTSYPTTSNPVMDGVVGPDEWSRAGSEADNPGLAGRTYAMWQRGLGYGDGGAAWRYDGKFSFLLHNIEQNTTFSNGGNPAYNVFDIYAPGNDLNKYLQVTVRYDGFTVDKYDISVAPDPNDPNANLLASVVFTYTPGSAPNETSSYDWDRYFGVYARGGFGNSAFIEGLEGAINSDNQLFEVAYRSADDAILAPVRRSLKDPDQRNSWQLVDYLDTTVTTVPEPGSFALLGLGLGALGLGRRRRAA